MEIKLNLNEKFLECLKKSFLEYLERGERSNGKLKILHSRIAKDIKSCLGNEYQVYNLDEDNGKEMKIKGRYVDKKVDITITKGSNVVAGFGIKFIMSNYKQNSNNYFENMLGETANIRTNNILYFQIIICFARPLYFRKKENNVKIIKRVESLKVSHLRKYQILSEDDNLVYLHSPTKTFFSLVDFSNIDCEKLFKSGELNTNLDFYNIIKDKGFNLKFNNLSFDKGDFVDDKDIFNMNLIYNNYQEFIEKCTNLIKGYF